ncbi:GNAT family N-acetyltransferase [Oculatella sp. LEGE 06141]|uniref:GNAT family N-acetyltransferase n=1 Tax=Oculatella sp. LEGE 06141 TaxID=1828648 RepID=UPI00187FE4BE|nr:GNAT family N-acetyltransferase [Oculatella sp. LEGE 06141]MBE9181431.1 GNAT family N-acetyltransferase [Oculatella sp. LEGE 06141]
MGSQEILLVEPCSVQHIEVLLAGKLPFFETFGVTIADDYELLPHMLEFSLKGLLETNVLPRWWTHLFMLHHSRVAVGIGGYKGNPDANGVVEIGYSIAPSYQGQGLATQAARTMIERAFADQSVTLVRAHTLATETPSASVLRKVGMVRVADSNDAMEGKVWRWQVTLPHP